MAEKNTDTAKGFLKRFIGESSALDLVQIALEIMNRPGNIAKELAKIKTPSTGAEEKAEGKAPSAAKVSTGTFSFGDERELLALLASFCDQDRRVMSMSPKDILTYYAQFSAELGHHQANQIREIIAGMELYEADEITIRDGKLVDKKRLHRYDDLDTRMKAIRMIAWNTKKNGAKATVQWLYDLGVVKKTIGKSASADLESFVCSLLEAATPQEAKQKLDQQKQARRQPNHPTTLSGKMIEGALGKTWPLIVMFAVVIATALIVFSK